MSIKKTQLTKAQINRMYNYCNDNGKLKSVTLNEVVGTKLRRIDIEYYNMGKETFCPDDDTLDFILNGIKLERNKA